MSTPQECPAQRLRFAVAGAGVIGGQHAKVIDELSDRIQLVAVIDPVLDRADELAGRYPSSAGAQAFATLGEALDSVDVDVVVVCTPTGLHGEVAIEALRAGTHVIIEKPAETTVAKTDLIIAAQQVAGKLVTVISQHRFDRSTEITVAAIAAGELGRLTTGIASIDWWRGQSYYDSGAWRGTWELDGGGALMNQGVHTVDLLVATMGRPVEVFAYTATLAHERTETEDAAVGVVRFENGALGVLHATTAAYPGLSARLQVHGDQGSVVIDNDELSFIHVTPQGAVAEEKLMGSRSTSLNQVEQYTRGPAGAAAASNPGLLSDAHRLQYENFLAALAGTEPLRVDLQTNRQAISIITGVYESARTGRPVAL
ncbi:MAG: Gfo/Idh/MocA family protein [Propionibacteriaceae bacterium]